MKLSSMTAAKLRIVLLFAMALLLLGLVGGFLLVQQSLTGYANAISQLNADADTGDQSIATLRALEERLDNEKKVIDTAHSVVGDSTTFADQVVTDITRIASQAGVTISSFEFVDAAAATTPTTTPAAAVPVAIKGASKKEIAVTIDSPVEYARVMNFIKGIETNDLKLQIARIGLTKAEGSQVGTQTFSIGVYVR